jgi:ribosomal RNA-processing protein 36
MEEKSEISSYDSSFEELYQQEAEEDARQGINEEDQLKEELEEIEFGKLIEAQNKLTKEENKNSKKNKIQNKKQLEENFLKINQTKTKAEPREFSALIKPKKKLVGENVKKSFKRDPRFDNISGQLKEDMFKINYEFVKEEAKVYINKLDKLKKEKKGKLEPEAYNLVQKQINFVKSWMHTKKNENIKNNVKKDIISENRERLKNGKNPIYLKKTQLNKIYDTVINENRDDKETKKFLRRKKHKETFRNKKDERDAKSQLSNK